MPTNIDKHLVVSAMANFPYGAEFSPDVFDLQKVIALISAASGSSDKLKSLIRTKYWNKPGRSARSSIILSMNTYLSIKSYGLIEETSRSNFIETPLLSSMKMQTSSQGMIDELNRFLIASREGFVFLKILEALKAQDISITMTSINAELTKCGYTNVNSTNKYISTMRAWLSKSNLFKGDSYDVNWANVHSLLGLSGDELEKYLDVTTDQLNFLRALVAIGGSSVPVNAVCQYSRETLNCALPEKNLSTQVIRPLAELGYIGLQKRTAGRGAKPHAVSLKTNAKTKRLLELLGQLQNLPADLRVAIAFPLKDILVSIDSSDKYKKGVALEHLAIWFTRALGLSFLEWRSRSTDTGGAEVDVLAERRLLTQERWQIQCKNTQSSIGSEVIAREVGLAVASGNDVILIVTTSQFSTNAKSFCRKVHQRSMLKVILLDSDDLVAIKDNPHLVGAIVAQKAVSSEGHIEEINIHLEAQKLSATKVKKSVKNAISEKAKKEIK
ncbi:MAG: restriction endonuclease [Bdellovibrionales bacterium]|nr:restriction endonuclease [Bdellovibrionales bacterium]